MENPNCPCKKKRCVRHGNCAECRKYHAETEGELAVACERKTAVKKQALVIVLLFAAAVCLTVSVFWMAWSRSAYSKYSAGMEKSSASTVMAPAYYSVGDDYSYYVQFPKFLSNAGNLTVYSNDEKAPVQAFVMWPARFSGAKYGVLIQDKGEKHLIYTDSAGKPKDAEFAELARKYEAEIKAIADAAAKAFNKEK